MADELRPGRKLARHRGALLAGQEPRRLLLICLPLGIFRDSFVPKQAGAAYEITEHLAPLADLRDRFTVVSGLEHPGVGGGHSAQPRIFPGAPSADRNRRSLDQYVAATLGQHTRFDSLALSAGANDFGWTDGGSLVPAEKNVGDAFANSIHRWCWNPRITNLASAFLEEPARPSTFLQVRSHLICMMSPSLNPATPSAPEACSSSA